MHGTNSANNEPSKESGSRFSFLPFLSSRLSPNPKDVQTIPTSGTNQIPPPPYQSHDAPPSYASDQASVQHSVHNPHGQPQPPYYAQPISNANQQIPGPHPPPYYYQPRQTTNGQTHGSAPTYYTQPPLVPNQGPPQTSPPYYTNQALRQSQGSPTPTYYSQGNNANPNLGSRQGSQNAPPQGVYYSQGAPNSSPNPNPSQNPNQPSYPGWQGPYYNPQSTSATSQSPYNATYYPPSTR